jgi:diguanylate cyclase (GGDEF)-like protein
LLGKLDHAGPARVLLLSADYRTARRIDELLNGAGSGVQLLVHADWDAAAAQALVDHPRCCVLLDASLGRREDTLELVEYVRLSAPAAPIILLTDGDPAVATAVATDGATDAATVATGDDVLALEAVRAGAQDCLVKSELHPALLRRALTHAIERKRSEAELVRRALHDQLTGLPNRVLFLDRLGVALERSRRSRTQLAVLFLDLDNFKHINDSRGHAVGDRLLAALGHRVSRLLRPMDTVARFGGDEFTFLFEDLSSEREVVLIADRICQAASRPIEIDGVALTVTVSVGITMVADPSVAPETVIREADDAMYRAKERGRSRFELFDEDSRRRAIARIELEAALRQAVEHGQLRLHYRPSIALHGLGDVAWVEARVHWQHPGRGLLGPDEFMRLAEATGTAVPIGRFALAHAVAHLARWRLHKPDMRLSVSISPQQLRDVNALSEAIRTTACDPGTLCLEIPESAVGEDPEAATAALRTLKATGVALALVEFGSGAAPFLRVRELPIDVIKLHESFISTLEDSDANTAIVAALVELGHALGVDVVAAGVQTEAQLNRVRELGFDAAQGEFLGPLVTAAQLEAQLMAEVP